MNSIKIDLDRRLGSIDRAIFGGFAEHLGRCIYGGIYEPDSPYADESGFRSDVLAALRRLRMPVIRYPGGNFVSGYRWRDGVGPRSERPSRLDVAWGTVETNQFGTDEFVAFCRAINSQPYLVVNCGDGDMREARDWVEYCNGTQDTALVRMRRANGYDAPHNVRYWGIGNEVDGHWQIGYKTPQEYARAVTEFGKYMKMVDPSIKLLASTTSDWKEQVVERAQLVLEQAAKYIDYLAIHWYVGNPENNFAEYMALSELIEERLSAYEGLIRAVRLDRKIAKPIYIAVDEWNVWYRANIDEQCEEPYNLEDALVVAMHLNAFIRHCAAVRMANIAQIVNVISPIHTRPDGLLLHSTFYPFELYSKTCGDIALDVWWDGETFASKQYGSVRLLDVSATLDSQTGKLAIYVVNRSENEAVETTLSISGGHVSDCVDVHIVNGRSIKSENSFDSPEEVCSRNEQHVIKGQPFVYAFEPHSVTAIICDIK